MRFILKGKELAWSGRSVLHVPTAWQDVASGRDGRQDVGGAAAIVTIVRVRERRILRVVHAKIAGRDVQEGDTEGSGEKLVWEMEKW